MDNLALTDVARFSHILAVAIGFGAAALADFHALSRIHRRVDATLLATLQSCHKLVWAMLGLMWVTGLMLVFIRTGFVLENFSPKLMSKLVTVAILTGNAVMISRYAVPVVEACEGHSLLVLPLAMKTRLAAIGAVSAASWLLAMAMGVSKVLAASSWPVFVITMPAVYLGSMALVAMVMSLVHVGMNVARHVQPAAEAKKPEAARIAA